MASLSVFCDSIVLCFSEKVIVLKRSENNEISCEHVFPIEREKSEQVKLPSDGHIPMICSAFSSSGKYFAVCVNKALILWETSMWTKLGIRSLARSASCITFSAKGNMIIISDKSGDAYLLHVNEMDVVPQTCDIPLLGHVSMLLKVALSPDDKYMVTCDRDEKIRVSHFPNAYNIKSFCLGHTDCVTCLDFPESSPDLLISGSSDGTVRLWRYVFGKQLLKHNCSPDETIVVDLKSLVVNETNFRICVVLNKLNYMQLLSVKHSNEIECSILHNIPISCPDPRALVINKSSLFVLSYNSPYISSYESNDQTSKACDQLNENLKSVTKLFDNEFSSIKENISDEHMTSYLNKRKVDDTRDYFVRKNARLLGCSDKKIKS